MLLLQLKIHALITSRFYSQLSKLNSPNSERAFRVAISANPHVFPQLCRERYAVHQNSHPRNITPPRVYHCHPLSRLLYTLRFNNPDVKVTAPRKARTFQLKVSKHRRGRYASKKMKNFQKYLQSSRCILNEHDSGGQWTGLVRH